MPITMFVPSLAACCVVESGDDVGHEDDEVDVGAGEDGDDDVVLLAVVVLAMTTMPAKATITIVTTSDTQYHGTELAARPVRRRRYRGPI